jgi:hypothetical protein
MPQRHNPAVADILVRIDTMVFDAAPSTLNDVLRLHDQLIDLVRELKSSWNDNLMLKYVQGSVGEFDVIYSLAAESRDGAAELTEKERDLFEEARTQLRNDISEARAFLAPPSL